MGGARCSYRNCTQKTDQVTHMFHYPVFDKVRCHQWITNAQKYNFLDLTLSQLRNRLICQHHFTDDSFMNNLKNKLKSNAVPTLHGPYCTPAFDQIDEDEANKGKELPINIEDIENDVVFNSEKRAHLSVKYGDFLTNDVTDNVTLLPNSKKSTSIVVGDKGIVFKRRYSDVNSIDTPRTHYLYNMITREKKPRIVSRNSMFPRLAPKPHKTPIYNIVVENKPNYSECMPATLQIDSNQTSDDTKSQSTVYTHSTEVQKPRNATIPISKRVKIISEKQISEPLRITKGEFQPVSPSIVISVPRKKERSNVEIDGQKIQTIFMEQPQNSQIDNNREELAQIGDPFELNAVMKMSHSQEMPSTNSQVEIMEDIKPIEYLEDTKHEMKPEAEMFTNTQHTFVPASEQWTQPAVPEQPVASFVDLTSVSSTVADTSYVENKSEAMAGLPNICNTVNIVPIVQENNNDDSEKQLSQMSPTKSVKNKIPPEKLAEIEEKRKYNMKLRDIIDSCLKNMDEEPEAIKLNAMKKKEMNNKKVSEHLANTSKQDNNIAYLEARLQRLEDTLLNKIEQNTQKITDLKKSLKPKTLKKAAGTQTYQTAEATKKGLYHQISQYLSAEANSLIYEELFINSCVSKQRESPRKRSKRIIQ